MNQKFDELTKGLAQSVTRRGALTKFTMGLVAVALGALGLAMRAQGPQQAACLPSGYACQNDKQCCSGWCERYKVRNGGVIKVCA